MTPEMEKTPDQTIPEAPAENPASATKGTAVTRRQFSRGLVGGSAVLLTLANRPAWGLTTGEFCISARTWDSYQGNKAGFDSRFVANPDLETKIMQFDAHYSGDELIANEKGDYCIKIDET